MTANGENIRAWDFSSEEIESGISGSRLLNPSIDLANPCDLNCPYCFIEEKNSPRKVRRADELTLKETYTILTDFADGGARTINIVGAGEPLLDPHFRDIIKTIYEFEMCTMLFTNGTRLAKSEELVHFLYEHDVSIVLKYNSNNQELQDAVVGKRGYAETRDIAYSRLLSRGFNSEVPTRLGFDTIAFAGNLHELPDMHRYCRENNIFPIIADYIPIGRTMGGSVGEIAAYSTINPALESIARTALLPLTETERASLANTLRDIDSEYGIVHDPNKAYYSGSPCTQLLGLYVDIRGYIWPCVARTHFRFGRPSHLPLGTIRQGDCPTAVWRNSKAIGELRDSYDGHCPFKASFSELTILGQELESINGRSLRVSNS